MLVQYVVGGVRAFIITTPIYACVADYLDAMRRP
jgi:hypothetical protein